MQKIKNQEGGKYFDTALYVSAGIYVNLMCSHTRSKNALLFSKRTGGHYFLMSPPRIGNHSTFSRVQKHIEL